MFSKVAFFIAQLALVVAVDTLPSTVVTQLEEGSWLENIAVRPNGDLLATLLEPTPDIIIVRSPSSRQPKTEVLTSIPALTRLLGITEVSTGKHGKETYVIVGDNGSQSCSAYAVTFGRGRHRKPTVSKIIDFDADTTFVNGLTSIPGIDNAILVGDSAGRVGYLNLSAGTFDPFAFDYPALKPDNSADLKIGVNGIKISDGYLYFSNFNLLTLSRIAITPQGYPAPHADTELVADLATIGVIGLDDFAFDKHGNIYLTSNIDNKLVYVEVSTGKSTVVVGGDLEMTVAGDTAAAFGRGHSDSEMLYVVTAGGKGAPVGGNRTEGAKVVAVDTSKLHLA
ncbi:uncharacterized protein DNG_00001 [Cephalotrichum gorgonifer]|uniref:SMP-30/Gluconolactonase/LRE-like region domain-containing protein n=1 Tax=Cephalotrichum gorgonifer TaxID=2041049 RepID=A0AAE8SQH8_9PEZI|nr:uncharacterized protein DNG_00001 [Cephalotrichum gorgonifer]